MKTIESSIGHPSEFDRFIRILPIFLLLPIHVFGQATFEGVEQVCVNSNVNSITVNVPSGGANELLIAAISSDYGFNENYTTPAGWTLEYNQNDDPGDDAEIVVFYRVTDGSEPVSYTFNCSQSSRMCGAILRYSQINPLSPIEISNGDNNPFWINPPEITTTLDDNVILALASANDPLSPVLHPSAMTERVDISSDGHTLLAADYIQTTSGAYNPPLWDAGIIVNDNVTVNVAIKWQDPCAPGYLGSPDSDGDGINDICDLDDDNDGIPDHVECSASFNKTGASWTNGPFHVYTASGNTDGSGIVDNGWFAALNGTTPNVVDTWNAASNDTVSFANGTVSLSTISGAAATMSTDNGNTWQVGSANNGLLVVPGSGSSTSSIAIAFDVPVHAFSIDLIDIYDCDNIGTAVQQFQVYVDGQLIWELDDYNIGFGGTSTTTQLDGDGNGRGTVSIGQDRENTISVVGDVLFDNVEIVLQVNVLANPWHIDSFGLDFLHYLTTTDTDNDQIPDCIDLDSDNDGIYDLEEAGHGEIDANADGIIDGASSAFGTNGLYDGAETIADNGILNYSISDTDSDGVIDAKEIDADADGCYDVLEAGFTDDDLNAMLGPSPLGVNANGVVVSGSDGYTGSSPFVTNALQQSGCPDNDGDLVSDLNDLDDDNDGIPDKREWAAQTTNTMGSDWKNGPFHVFNASGNTDGSGSVDNGWITALNGQVPNVIDNWSPNVGNTITFDNGTISLSTLSGQPGSISWLGDDEIQVGSGNTGILIQPGTGGNANDDNVQSISIDFVEPVHVFSLDLIDLFDCAGTGTEEFEIYVNDVLIWELNDSHIGSSSVGTTTQLDGDGVPYGIVDVGENLENTVSVISDVPIDQVELVVRIDKQGGPSGQDAFGIDYLQYLSPQDSDTDGVADHLDLDSDNDGIYDHFEAGHGQLDSDLDGQIDGVPADFGGNGLFNGLETSIDNGVLNYLINDSDGDGSLDCIELDSDGDGCFDVLEAGFLDMNNDGILGTVPVIVDSQGRVVQ